MIQRIQTIFLLVAAGACLGLFATPIASSETAIASSEIFQDQVFNIQDHPGLMALFAGSGIIALISIFLFNNRRLQTNINWLSLLLNIAGVGLGVYLFYGSNITASIQPGIGIALPVIALICIFLANRNINKDEKLVQSMDRLR